MRRLALQAEVLDVKLQGASIARALEWTVDQAMQRLHRHPRLWRARSGISSRWGSDTCAWPAPPRRCRAARRRPQKLPGAGADEGRARLYILDEPTTGLHLDDVRVLCRVLDRLVDAGTPWSSSSTISTSSNARTG